MQIFTLALSLAIGTLYSGTIAGAADQPQVLAPFGVSITVDAAAKLRPFNPAWRFFGADEPNYATMKNGDKLMRELGNLKPNQVYFRTHNLLTSGDGTAALKWGSTNAYTEDKNGRPVYDWKILDGIFDSYLKHKVRPYVEIGFMPEALSTNPEPYRHHWTPTASYDEIYRGWAYPPKDYSKWEELIFQWASHCVKRYGMHEVEHWYWETWNEPNIGYWRGTRDEYYRLHDTAVAAVRRAIPQAKVGGPDSAGGGSKFLHEFLLHCAYGTNYATGTVGTPVDFVSFHAKGSPSFFEGHVRMGIANQLRDINSGFEVVSSVPEFRNTPIIIGESDPDGCAACQGPALGYRNGTMYSSYTAACMARELQLAEIHRVKFEGAVTWAFEFEDQPYFAGFRQLSTNGIDMPVINVFKMLSKMGGSQLKCTSSAEIPLDEIMAQGVRGAADVSAIATIDQHKLNILAWHYHDDDVAGPPASIILHLKGLSKSSSKAFYREFRIDEHHSNAFAVWKAMGQPQSPSSDQYRQLELAGQLQEINPGRYAKVKGGESDVSIELPRQAVSLIQIDQ